MIKNKKRIVLIGGSAGSIKIVFNILQNLPKNYSLPVILVLHRPDEHNSQMLKIFQSFSTLPIIEPTGETFIENGKAYLAPGGYHLIIEDNFALNVDKSPLVQYSRPSIDVLFISASEVYKENVIGVLLTGSNEDGALGMKSIHENGGLTIVQDPKEAAIPRMPIAAINNTKIDYIISAEKITKLLIKIGETYYTRNIWV